MRFQFELDGHAVDYDVEGEYAYGPDHCLLDGADNLIATTSWSDAGYTVAPFLDAGSVGATTRSLYQSN